MHPLEKPCHPSPFPTPTAAKGSRLLGHKAAGPGRKEPSVPRNRLTKRPAVDHSARIDIKPIEQPSPQTARRGIRVLPGMSPSNPSSLCLDKSFSSKRNRSVDSAIGSSVSSAGSFGDPEEDLPTRNWGDLVVASDTLEGSLSLTLGDLRLQHKADLNLQCPEDATSPPTDQESPHGQQYPSPQDGSGVGASHSNTSSSQSLKRPSRPNNGGNDEDQGKESRKGKRRVGPTGSREPLDAVLYSCPFRKLDPTTFNVRDHDKCANNPWKGISNLKSHIKYSHDFNQYPCRRCWEPFDTRDDLHLHQRSPEPCPLRESPPNMTDPKDGITIVARGILGSRKDDEKVTSWDRLWTVLFGEGVPIKDHNFVPVVELEEVMLEFDVQLPSFITAFDAHVKKLFGDLVNHSFRQHIESIKKFVQQWMRELLDKCREIPSRMQTASSPSDLSRHIDLPAERTPEDARFNPSLLEIGTQGEDGHEACNFLTEWMTADRVSDVMMADQMDRPLNNVDITRNWQHPELPNRGIERVSQQTDDGRVFNQHCPPNGNIMFNSSFCAPPPMPAPMPTTPSFAERAEAFSRARPLLGDALAHRAVQMSVRQQQAMRHGFNQQQQQPEQQEPRIPLTIQKFYQRNSASGKPISRPGSEVSVEKGLRDSGVSDMGSIYGDQGNIWQVHGAGSPECVRTVSHDAPKNAVIGDNEWQTYFRGNGTWK